MARFFVAKTRTGPAEPPTTPLTAFVKGDKGDPSTVPGPPGTAQKRTVTETFGRGDNAAGFVTIVNGIASREAQILGGGALQSPDNEVARYHGRDAVANYTDIQGKYLLMSVSGTYTATTFVPTAAISVGGLKVGMFIETSHVPKYTGTITGWAANGSSVTVSGWFAFGNVAADQVPAGTSVAKFDPLEKIWAHNANVFLQKIGGVDQFTDKATGFEMGGYNNRGAPNLDTALNYMCMFDAINLVPTGLNANGETYFAMSYGFQQRGHMKIGYHSEDAEINGFRVKNGTTRNPFASFMSEATNNVAFSANPAGRNMFAVRTDGIMELGYHDGGTASANQFRFHSSGLNVDYDSVIKGMGGSATNGTGELRVAAANFSVFNAAEVDGIQLYGGSGLGVMASFGASANVNMVVQAKGVGVVQLGTATNMLGFYGIGGTTRPTITGSRGVNVVLANLLAALSLQGIILDSTTA